MLDDLDAVLDVPYSYSSQASTIFPPNESVAAGALAREYLRESAFKIWYFGVMTTVGLFAVGAHNYIRRMQDRIEKWNGIEELTKKAKKNERKLAKKNVESRPSGSGYSSDSSDSLSNDSNRWFSAERPLFRAADEKGLGDIDLLRSRTETISSDGEWEARTGFKVGVITKGQQMVASKGLGKAKGNQKGKAMMISSSGKFGSSLSKDGKFGPLKGKDIKGQKTPHFHFCKKHFFPNNLFFRIIKTLNF